MPKMEKAFKITSRRYLGSKTKLLSFIHKTIEEEKLVFNSFLDLFAGTGSVAASFNNEDTRVLLNDILECNRCSFNAFFGAEEINESKLQNFLSLFKSSYN